MRTGGILDEASRVEFCAPGFLDSLVEREIQLRIDYRNIPEAPEEKARKFVKTAVAFLELVYVTAVGVEVVHRYGAKTAEQALAQSEGISQQVCLLTKLSLPRVFKENAESIAVLAQLKTEALPDELPELEKVVSAVTSMLLAYPLKGLADLANAVQLSECAARCQVAHEGLSHFVRRNDQWLNKRLHVIGVQYASGQLSIDDVANVLALPAPDAVALLEDHGYSRPLERVALNESQRSGHYERLRKDRLAREGRPGANSTRVIRDVIASQRIEDIDARPWVETKLM